VTVVVVDDIWGVILCIIDFEDVCLMMMMISGE
jgi:hypothetical protein